MTRQDRILHKQCSASLLLGFYGGKGARLPSSHVCTSRARASDTSDAHRLTGSKTTLALLRFATTTQNEANFRSAEASRQGCSTRPLAQTSDRRHDSDDGGGRQCSTTHMERDHKLSWRTKLQQRTQWGKHRTGACFGRARSPPWRSK